LASVTEQPIQPLVGRGSEAQVQSAFEDWLVAAGWTIKRVPGSWIDVTAERDGLTLRAEVKGRTGTNTNLDVDTMYGQLLRRMTPDLAGGRWAVVVPTSGLNAVMRVDARIRSMLGIEVFEVRDDGSVVEHLA
jgi:hypothetical protein